MANSKKPPVNSVSSPVPRANQKSRSLPDSLNGFLSQYLKTIDPNPTLLLGLSGGLDSMVLLHLLADARQLHAFSLAAMHVHHGLSPHADQWAAFCVSECERLKVPVQVRHVNVAKNPHYKNSEQGIEAEARQLRYQALLESPQVWVVTAHHQDDQAETLLLQLFRGAGVKGLACMAEADIGRRLLRPLLGISREVLQQYALKHDIRWCDDESNDNTQYDRNFVRHEVMPVLAYRFKGVQAVLARTAKHMAEADMLLEILAEQDARNLIDVNTKSICLQGLRELSQPRIKNVLRWWFVQNKLSAPNADHLHEIVEQLLNSRDEANLNISLQHFVLRKYQHRAYLCRNNKTEDFDVFWQGESELTLPSGDKLIFSEVVGKGIALRYSDKLRITNRKGGERLKTNALRPTRSLKYLLQGVAMPPWRRQVIPLVYRDSTLACVPGIGVAVDFQAAERERGLEIQWLEVF